MSVRKSLARKLRGLAMRRLPGMITCRELDQFMVDYFDGALPEAQRRTFERHLHLCAECKRYVHAYGRTIALSRAALPPDEEMPPGDLPDELVEAILAARKEDDP